MSSYDPSQWYSYSKNKPDELPSKKILVDSASVVTDTDKLKGKSENLSSSSDLGQNQQQQQQIVQETKTAPNQKHKAEIQTEPKPIQSNNAKMNNFVKRLQKMVRELPR